MSRSPNSSPTASREAPTRDDLSASQLEKLCYRLGTSLKAGISVSDAWRNETELLRGRQRRAFERVHQQLKKGGSLALALSAAGSFPHLLIAIVHVGEETGRLDQAFLRLANHYRAIVRISDSQVKIGH